MSQAEGRAGEPGCPCFSTPCGEPQPAGGAGRWSSVPATQCGTLVCAGQGSPPGTRGLELPVALRKVSWPSSVIL